MEKKIRLPITVRSPDSVRNEIPESPLLNIYLFFNNEPIFNIVSIKLIVYLEKLIRL